MGCWVLFVGSNPTIHNEKTFSDFSHVEPEKYSPRYTQENETAWILTRPPVYFFGRPATPPFQVRSVTRLSFGKLLVNLLQVVTSGLIPH